MSISVKELNKLDKETYELIDIRSDAEIAHGVMPGAIQVSVDETMIRLIIQRNLL